MRMSAILSKLPPLNSLSSTSFSNNAYFCFIFRYSDSTLELFFSNWIFYDIKASLSVIIFSKFAFSDNVWLSSIFLFSSTTSCSSFRTFFADFYDSSKSLEYDVSRYLFFYFNFFTFSPSDSFYFSYISSSRIFSLKLSTFRSLFSISLISLSSFWVWSAREDSRSTTRLRYSVLFPVDLSFSTDNYLFSF